MLHPNQEIAIVVPTRNSESTLELCLQSIRNQSVSCTIVVVDNGSTDSTISIAQAQADLVLHSGPERSAQRNCGAAATSATLLGFIDSDMVLDPQVVEEVVTEIEAGATSIVVPEETTGEGFWAAVSSYERSFYHRNDSIEAPRFFRREIFEEVSGFDEAMTGAEDWDIGLRTRELGPRSRISAKITHDEGRVRYFNVCMKKAYYAPGVALFVKKHGLHGVVGMSNRSWLRQPRALIRPLGIGLLALKLGQAIAMVVAVLVDFLGHQLKLPSRPAANSKS